MELDDLESHQEQGGEHAEAVTGQDNRFDEAVHLDEEGNEESKAIAKKHPNVDLPSVSVLEVNNVPQDLLLADVSLGFLDDVQDEVGQVVVIEVEILLTGITVATRLDLPVLVNILFNVIYLPLEKEKSHVKE